MMLSIIFISIFATFTNFEEIIIRSNVNETWANLGPFVWTNVTLLSFCLLIWCCGWFSFINSKSHYFCILIWWEPISCLPLPIMSEFLRVNNLLTNALTSYHPFFLYLALGLILINLINGYHIVICKMNIRRTAVRFPCIYILKIVTNCFLIFGGWWAFQEGTWGGWWNWDSSEFFGLLIFNYWLLEMHYRFRDSLIFKIPFMLIAMLLFSIYFLLQLNFTFISHNFGLRINFVSISFAEYENLILVIMFIAIQMKICKKHFLLCFEEILMRPPLFKNAIIVCLILTTIFYVFRTFLLSANLLISANFVNNILLNHFFFQLGWMGIFWIFLRSVTTRFNIFPLMIGLIVTHNTCFLIVLLVSATLIIKNVHYALFVLWNIIYMTFIFDDIFYQLCDVRNNFAEIWYVDFDHFKYISNLNRFAITIDIDSKVAAIINFFIENIFLLWSAFLVLYLCSIKFIAEFAIKFCPIRFELEIVF